MIGAMRIWSLVVAAMLVAIFVAGARAADNAETAGVGHDAPVDRKAHEQAEASHGEAADRHGDAAHGDAGHGGGGHGSPNPLEVGPDLAMVTAVVFVLLLLVLSKFAWKPILEALDRREQHIADNLAAADAKHQDARRLLEQYEQKLASAADDVRALLDEARRDAERAKASILGEAKSAAQAEQQRALREIRNATDAALKALAEKCADQAVELAGKIVGQRLTPSDHARLIREAIEQFPNNN